MRKLVTVLVVLAVLLVVFLLLGPFYILSEGEQSVVTRFGRIVDTQREAGLKFKMPLVDQVTKYSSRLQSWDGEAQRIPTAENQFIWVDATARWYISEPALFYETVGTMESGLGRLNDIIDSTIRTVISQYSLNEAVRSTNQINEINVVESFQDVESAEDAETLKTLTNTTVSQQRIEVGREGLSNIILEEASEYTDTYGITLEDVIIRQIRYSDDLTESVYERMIKERNQIAEWRGQTERDRQTILSQAEAEAARIRGEADAEAARIYAESYSANPDFFELYNSLESYKVTLPATDKVLSTDGEYFKYL